jgi:hypothetical protein
MARASIDQLATMRVSGYRPWDAVETARSRMRRPRGFAFPAAAHLLLRQPRPAADGRRQHPA